MKTLLILSMVLLFAINGNGNCAEDPKPNEDAARARIGDRDGLVLSLCFDKREWNPLEPITCVVTLKNISGYDISFLESGFLALFKFKIITDASEKQIPLTKFSESLLDRRGVGSQSTQTLKPGGSYIISILQLNRIYDMTLNGKYSVSVEFIGERLPKDTSKVVSKVEKISIDENNSSKYAIFVPEKKKEKAAETKK